jgi:hypothetical protein
MELTNPTSTPLPPWCSGLIPDLHDAIWSGGGHHDHAAWQALEVLQRRGLLVQSETEGVTDEELLKMAAKELGYEFSPKWFLTGKNCPSLETDPYELLGFARAVLARYARPTIEPVPVAERLPEPGKKVLAHYLNALGKPRTIIAEWVPAKTREDSPDGDLGEYDDETDLFYWPEGWYEQIENWDDFTALLVDEGEITHWQPLPRGPHHALPLPQQPS